MLLISESVVVVAVAAAINITANVIDAAVAVTITIVQIISTWKVQIAIDFGGRRCTCRRGHGRGRARV